MLDTTTGEVVKMTLKHEGHNVREFYSTLPRPVQGGNRATGSMQWFVELMEDLGIECLVWPSRRDSSGGGKRSMIGEMRTYFYHC
jgi:hypothetical protein